MKNRKHLFIIFIYLLVRVALAGSFMMYGCRLLPLQLKNSEKIFQVQENRSVFLT